MAQETFSNFGRHDAPKAGPKLKTCSFDEEWWEDPDCGLPDKIYRQVKELHLALDHKASELSRRENQLQRLIADYEREKRSLDMKRMGTNSQDALEQRLDRLIQQTSSRSPTHGNRETSDQETGSSQLEKGLSELELSLRIGGKPPLPRITEGPDDTAGGSTNPLEPEDLSKESGPTPDRSLDRKSIRVDQGVSYDRPGDSVNPDEVDRLQSSAHQLRMKSEILSAVFIELDQMVRELGHQQELLESLSSETQPNSIDEVQSVGNRLQKRFKRLSRQIARAS